MKAIILAAGLGTRLMPLTKSIPKPLLPLNGKPLIQRNIEWLRSNGIKEIAINLHHLPEKIKTFLGDGSKFGVRITYSYEKNIMGTAGGVKNLENFAKNSAFMVYYGDNITNLNIKKLVSFHKNKGGIATICLHPIKEEELKDSSIVELDNKSKLLGFQEKPGREALGKINGKCYSNAGIYILEPEIFNFIEKNKFADFAKDIFPMLIKKGKKLYGYPLDCFWAEIGNAEKYKNIKKIKIK